MNYPIIKPGSLPPPATPVAPQAAPPQTNLAGVSVPQAPYTPPFTPAPPKETYAQFAPAQTGQTLALPQPRYNNKPICQTCNGEGAIPNTGRTAREVPYVICPACAQDVNRANLYD